jgi:glycerophosphoryl diester phosphodiesterase
VLLFVARVRHLAAPMELGEHGEGVPGPPWILGHRGAPREAPENTLAGLRRALELGLDGVEYDVHACQGGEPILIHDETLDRTTDQSGPVAARPLAELVHADAGGWFAKRFAGEPLPLLEEALELDAGGRPVHHMIELKDPSLVAVVARALARLARPVPFHVASFHRSVCLEARDAELPNMLLAEEANEDDRRFVRDERIRAYSTGPRGWHTAAGRAEWACERWAWSLDDPAELLAACRTPLFAFNTNEPRRALAVRALVRLAPEDRGPYPLRVPPLEVTPAADAPDAHGEWSGRWELALALRNPFPWPVKAALGFVARGGAFQVTGLPATLALDARDEQGVPVVVRGGSWSPLEDPSVVVRYAWRAGRASRALVLDAPLERVRTLRLGADVQRVTMLRERPGEPPASMTLRRRGAEILAAVEDAGGLAEVEARIRVGARVRVGRKAVRIRLSEELGHDGAAFSVGFEGHEPDGTRRLRRFAGGLPYGLGSGAPGRLFVAGHA